MFILQMSHQFIYPIDSPMPVAVCPSFSFFTSLFSKMNLQNLAETFWKSLERSAGSIQALQTRQICWGGWKRESKTPPGWEIIPDTFSWKVELFNSS